WLMMSLWDALRMNMMISYQELVRTFPNVAHHRGKLLEILTGATLKSPMKKVKQAPVRIE
ncbi:hypothetical protein, partial [Escherichia coli]|uniref:hypothetical protein n=1 Tax=Escherichia coli TaxID=562 RepID=UPI0021F23BF2|nr:hypothetical protein [Escherichia coli]